jgi:hypothetical protein
MRSLLDPSRPHLYVSESENKVSTRRTLVSDWTTRRWLREHGGTGTNPSGERNAVMKLRKLAKDAGSPTGECPAVYVAKDDPETMVVQGKLLDADTLANLDDPATDETAVRIPAETVIRAAERYLAEHGRPA